MLTRLSRGPRQALLALAAAAAATAAVPAQAETIIGLTTTNQLVSFDSASPMNAGPLNSISGLQSANERILSIDLRPTDGLLYGLSTDSKLYSLALDGSASFITALSTPILGKAVGIDFNPVADLGGMTSLRVVSSTGQNFAVNATTGATVVATPIQAGFTAVAYANNDLSPDTATALYYIDAGSDELKVAPSAFNNPMITTVGALGVDANGVAGFDIAGANRGYAALTDADTGKSGLYSIDLGTGGTSFIGSFGLGMDTAISPPLLGLTVAAIPEPETYALMLLGLAGVGFMARRRRQQT